MAEATVTQATQKQDTQTNNEKGQSVIKGILTFIKDWIEHICLGKPFYYKALEQIEKNLGELSTQNAFTTEILDDLYSVVSEMHGKMNNLTPDTLPHAIDDINSKIEAIKTKVDVFKSIDAVLHDENGNELKNMALFQKGNDLYIADRSGNKIGNTAYRIELNDNDNGIGEFILKKATIDKDMRGEFKIIPLNTKEMKFSEAIKEKIVDVFYSEDKAREYRDTLSTIKSMSKERSYLADKSNVIKDISELVKNDAGIKSYIDNKNRFCVADLINQKTLIFNFGKVAGKPCEEVYFADCDANGKPVDNKRIKVAEWREKEDGSISSLVSYDRAYIINNLMKFDATEKYLAFRGITIEDKTPTKEGKLSRTAKHNIDVYYKEMSELPQFKQMYENGATLRKTENAIEFVAKNNDITQFSFDKEGNPSEIRHKVAKDGGTFEKTHKIKGSMINNISNLDLPQDLLKGISVFTAAQRNIGHIGKEVVSKTVDAVKEQLNSGEKKTISNIAAPAPVEEKVIIEDVADTTTPVVPVVPAAPVATTKPVEPVKKEPLTVEQAAIRALEQFPLSFRNHLNAMIDKGELSQKDILEAAIIVPIAHSYVESVAKRNLTSYINDRPEARDYLINNNITMEMMLNNDQNAVDRVYDKARLDMDIIRIASYSTIINGIYQIKMEMTDIDKLPEAQERFENKIIKITDDVKCERSAVKKDTAERE